MSTSAKNQKPAFLIVGSPQSSTISFIDELRSQGFQIDIIPIGSREDIIRRFDEIRKATMYQGIAFFIGCHVFKPFDEGLLGRFMPTLKVVSGVGAGYDHVDVDYLTSKGVYYANSPNSVADPTATTSVMLILQAVRAASQAEINVRQGKWVEGLEITPDIRDITVGILGMGSIGQLVRQKVQALGMRVIYNNRKQLPREEEGGAIYVSFDELLTQSDVISVHIPLTPTTHHLLSDKEFSRMKDGVFIVNTGRGPVIDEEALVRAMQSGKVLRVGLDVYEHEPTVHPWLLQSARATLLPHWAANSNRTAPDSEREVVENLRAWFTNGKPHTPVNNPDGFAAS